MIFHSYTPENPVPSVAYHKNEMVGDWYEYRATLSPEGMCILVDGMGYIAAATNDPLMINPEGYEFFYTPEYPEDLFDHDDWMFIDEEYVRQCYTQEGLEEKECRLRAERIKEVKEEIFLLEAKKTVGMSIDEGRMRELLLEFISLKESSGGSANVD